MKRILKIIAKWAAILLTVFLIFTCLQVALLRLCDPPFSSCMLWEWLKTRQKFNLVLEWAPLTEISPHLARAVLSAEDQRFYQHHGFDWQEINNALDEHQKSGRLRGASTITMQTARNMFLWADRSWIRKALEAYYSVLLELMLSKNRILEIYLNICEFGPGVFGAMSASQTYFGRPPRRLTQDQAARLALLLPAPKKRSPLNLTPYLSQRKQFLIKQMKYIKLPGWPH